MQKKVIKKEPRNKNDTRHKENRKANGRDKSRDINNSIKCEWIKQCNQRQKLTDRIEKQDPAIFHLIGTHFRFRDTSSLKTKEWENIFMQT